MGFPNFIAMGFMKGGGSGDDDDSGDAPARKSGPAQGPFTTQPRAESGIVLDRSDDESSTARFSGGAAARGKSGAGTNAGSFKATERAQASSSVGRGLMNGSRDDHVDLGLDLPDEHDDGMRRPTGIPR